MWRAFSRKEKYLKGEQEGIREKTTNHLGDNTTQAMLEAVGLVVGEAGEDLM